MNPLRLRASNYRTFDDLDVSFAPGLTGILGELHDAPAGADSNGAGKSSILEAIDVALFGRRSLAGLLTRGGAATELMLELTFARAGETYRVRRAYSARGRGKTVVDFEIFEGTPTIVVDGRGEHEDVLGGFVPLTCESAKATQELIENTIGLSRSTFRNSSYLRQGDGSYADPARDPRERKELLVEGALGKDPVWPRAAERAKQDRKQAELELQRGAGEAEQLRASVAAKTMLVDELGDVHVEHAEVLDLLAAAEARLAELEERYRAAADTAGKRQALEAKLAAARADLERLQRADVAATEAVIAVRTARDELDTLSSPAATDELVQRERDLLAEIEAHRAGVQEHEAAKRAAEHADAVRGQHDQAAAAYLVQAAAARAKAGELEAHTVSTCQTCGQELPDEGRALAVKSYLDQVRELDDNARRERLHAQNVASVNVPPAPAGEPPTLQLADVRARLAVAQQQVQQRARLEERILQLQQTADTRPTIDQLESAAAVVTAVGQELDDLEPVDLDTIKREGEQARATVNEQRARQTVHAGTIARLEERLNQITAAEQRLNRLDTDAASLHKVVDECAVLERAFGRDGVPALILENRVIPQLEAEATRILAELGTSYRVELRTQAATKDGGLRDTLEVVVIDDTGEAPYDDFSGGEQTRIGLALRIALARLLATRRGAESRLLALDEPSYLDQAGMAALLEVLRRLQADFDTILLVSHVPELRDALEQTITVVKDGGRSRIETGDTVATAVEVAA